MIGYEIPAGERIDRAIAQMLRAANLSGETVSATFNDIDLTVVPGDDPVVIERAWRAELDARGRAYAASPKGIRAAELRALQVADKQAQIRTLVDEVTTTLDFDDLEAVIRWLDAYTDPADDVDVDKPWSALLVIVFELHGYEMNAFTGDAYDPNDREVVGRYLVGQALAGINEVGCPHPMFRDWAAKWLADKPIPAVRAPGEEMLKVSEIARDLRISAMTVYRLIDSGELKAFKVGRGYRVWRTDLDAYLRRQPT